MKSSLIFFRVMFSDKSVRSRSQNVISFNEYFNVWQRYRLHFYQHNKVIGSAYLMNLACVKLKKKTLACKDVFPHVYKTT